MSEFKVSVIIPVYNAEKYLRQAVESAVCLEEVGEIILVEDGSPDNALILCRQLEKEYKKIRVYTHPDGQNKGAGETRNLGLSKTSFEYISFLDADDWYLPNRFQKCKEIFLKDPSVDGVYEATGYYYEATQRLDPVRLTTIRKRIPTEALLFTLLESTGGRFTTDAITFRKQLLSKAGVFDPTLRLHQDTHLWLRLAYVGKLVPGEVDNAVAIRRMHDNNRIQYYNRKSRNLFFIKTFEWFENQPDVDKKSYRIIFNRYVGSLYSNIISRFIFSIIYLTRNPTKFKKLI